MNVTPHNAVILVRHLIRSLGDDWQNWSRQELLAQHGLKGELIRLYGQGAAIEDRITERIEARGWPEDKTLSEVATESELTAFECSVVEMDELNRALGALRMWERRIGLPDAGPELEPLP